MPRLIKRLFATGLPLTALVAATTLIAASFAGTRALHHDCAGSDTSGASEQPARQLVKVSTVREGNSTKFIVENSEYCEVTMTFDVTLSGLKAPVTFPYTKTFAGKSRTVAFVLEPEESGSKWTYSYTNNYKLGSCEAKHDDSVLYNLPYETGSRYKVTQAFGGSFSHKGSNKYAIDWKMNEGTPVHAARGGEVVKIKEDSETGGPSMSFDPFNNFVLIRHQDGTLGHYCHLLKDSVCVKVGDTVLAGQVIAKSGNTGFSSGPHLHFCVFRTIDGKERESVPVKFRTEGGLGTTLIAGRNYKATSSVTENASAQPKAAPVTTSSASTTPAVGAAGS